MYTYIHTTIYRYIHQQQMVGIIQDLEEFHWFYTDLLFELIKKC